MANDGRAHEHECISVDGIRDAKAVTVPVVQFIALSALPALRENTVGGGGGGGEERPDDDTVHRSTLNPGRY